MSRHLRRDGESKREREREKERRERGRRERERERREENGAAGVYFSVKNEVSERRASGVML